MNRRRRDGSRIVTGVLAVAMLVHGGAVAGGAATPAAVTASADAAATMVVGRHPGDSEVVLDLDVTAFRPPRHGGVTAVVTVGEDRDDGRRAEAGSFAVFPAKKFRATKPEEVRGFRLDAAPALTAVGLDTTTVRITVRLDPATEGGSAAGARLTLGAVRFVPRDDDGSGGAADDHKGPDDSSAKGPNDSKADNPDSDPKDQRPDHP